MQHQRNSTADEPVPAAQNSQSVHINHVLCHCYRQGVNGTLNKLLQLRPGEASESFHPPADRPPAKTPRPQRHDKRWQKVVTCISNVVLNGKWEPSITIERILSEPFSRHHSLHDGRCRINLAGCTRSQRLYANEATSTPP